MILATAINIRHVDWNSRPLAAPPPDLVLIKQAKQVQILALPSVCGACWRKRIACSRITTGRSNIASRRTRWAAAHADDRR